MKRILHIFSAIYVLIILIVGFISINADHMIGSNGYSNCIVTDSAIYIVEQSNKTSAIYTGDYDGTIRKAVKLSSIKRGLKLVDITMSDKLYVLAKSSEGYTVIQYSDALSMLARSETFVLAEKANAKSIRVYNHDIYITGIESGEMAADVYTISTEELISTDPMSDDANADLAEAVELDSMYRVDSQSGPIENAYYDGNTIIVNEDNPEEQAYIHDYSRSINLTYKQSFEINSNIMFLFLAAAFVGAILLIVAGNLVGMKRRFINQILINELFIIVGFITIALTSNKILTPIVWAIAFTIVNIILCLLEAKDMLVLSRNMKRISNENYDIIRPRGDFSETQSIWRGLNELRYQLEKCKYINASSTAAAMKFLPRNINTIFEKNSLDEINPGDNALVNGSFLHIHTGKDLTNDMVKALEDYEKSTDGMLIIGDCNVYSIAMLFRHKNEDIVHDGIIYLNGAIKDDYCALYFNDVFKFTLSGTATKSVISMTSATKDYIEALGTWLYKLGIRMVVTQDILEEEHIHTPVRHIGYYDMNGKRIEFYEILDVYSEHVRTRRMRNLAAFDEALSMFYKNDFYLARTAFSDILKTDYDDELSRWYLFMCEKYLNDTDIDDKSCALNPEN